MDNTPIPPMTWIGIVVAVAVFFGMSYFAFKAGSESKSSKKQSKSDTEHNKRYR